MAGSRFAIPETFARNTAEQYGNEGISWIERLPLIVAECARRWSLTIGLPFETLSFAYVLPAMGAEGTRAVRKVGFPDAESMTELEALRLFDGRGIARLLAFDREQHAMLLERLEPGTSLGSVS